MKAPKCVLGEGGEVLPPLDPSCELQRAGHGTCSLTGPVAGGGLHGFGAAHEPGRQSPRTQAREIVGPGVTQAEKDGARLVRETGCLALGCSFQKKLIYKLSASPLRS